jgi:hypothetical protein
MMFFDSGKELFLFVFGCLFLVHGGFWLAFARLSMKRIEKAMDKDGVSRPCPWDGVGWRAVWYAFAVGIPIGFWNPANDPLVDVPLLRRYANGFDRQLAFWFVLSGGCWMFLIFLGVFVFDFY